MSSWAACAWGAFASACPARASDDPRLEPLLARMSLEEKIGQMSQVDMLALPDQSAVRTFFIGSMLNGGSSDPEDNEPATWRRMVDGYLKEALKTRLGIPLLYGVDAVHGHNNILGAVIFPHNIGLGATRDPDLVEQAARATAEEVAGTDIRWAFAPCVAVAQDERWGRTYESFGQSTEWVSLLGAAGVRGLQGARLGADSASVLACAKHFVGDGGTENGVDQGFARCDEATLRTVHLPPFEAAIRAETGAIMVSYSRWGEVRMHAQKHLLTDVLKGELGFDGFLISDWAAIDQIDPDYSKDIEQSINAGLDMVMIPFSPRQRANNYVVFANDLKRSVLAGRVPQSRIDDAVRRILRIKFRMGLFEHPFADPALLATVGSDAHRAIARQCVRESLVLLKNEKHTLPFSKSVKTLAVVGSAADDLGVQCGGWTISWQGGHGNVTRGGTTVLEAIRKAVSPGTKVLFSPDGRAIAGADAVLVILGESPYTEGKGDRKDLRLPESDQQLVELAKAAGAPVATLLISGRPLVAGPALESSDAFIAAWLPGTEGAGVADVLFGDFAPTGKLPRYWPANNDQHAVGQGGEPRFPLGFGLTYSKG